MFQRERLDGSWAGSGAEHVVDRLEKASGERGSARPGHHC